MSSLRRALLCTAWASVVALRPTPSRACSCLATPPIVLPSLSAPAPIDTHVWVHAERLLDEELYDDKGNSRGKTDRVLELRTAALPGKPSTVVDGTTNRFGAAAMTTIELVPKGELAPQTLYEVWLVDRSPLARTFLAGAFRTGSGRDAGAPTWTGLTKAVANDPGWPDQPFSLAGDCGEALHADLFGPAATDDGPVLYALWMAPAGVGIDYDKPPLAIVKAEREGDALLAIGALSCQPTDVVLPAGGSVRVGAAAIDLAGKRSATSEVSVDLRPPPTAKRPRSTH